MREPECAHVCESVCECVVVERGARVEGGGLSQGVTLERGRAPSWIDFAHRTKALAPWIGRGELILGFQ